MQTDASMLKQTYIDWVKDMNYIDINNKWVEIQTPFTNIYGDIIVLFFKNNNGIYYLTDYGNTINEFSLSGMKLSKQRKDMFEKYIKSQDCLCNEKEIYVRFNDIKKFPVFKHKLIQAIINILDVFLLTPSDVKDLFIFDVKKFLDEKGIGYNPRGYTVNSIKYDLPNFFDINIGKKGSLPSLHTRIINRLDDNLVKAIIYTIDNMNLYQDEKIATIINDVDATIKKEKSIEILKQAKAEVIPWTNRDLYFSRYA